MKPTSFIAGLAAFTFCATSYADVVVDITGATAFRAATLLSIRAQFNASGQPYKFAHDQATAGGTIYSGATRSIWIGSFPGVSGTTTIRTSFNGSVEGIRALVDSPASDPTYYQSALLNATTAIAGGAELSNQGSTGATASQSEIAFSDVSKTATPYASSNLQPSSPAVGVVAFTMLTNEGSSVTNVTAQQLRAVLTNGFQPLSMFTGNAADTTNVFAVGRNDGSGTRSTCLAETGYGVSSTVKQYVTIASTSTALSTIMLVPAGGVYDNNPGLAGVQPAGQLAANASTVWGQDVIGNGGYSSGSTLRTDMGKTGLAVTVLDDLAEDSFGGPVRADLVTWLSVNDAVTARGNGAVFCGYNGVRLDGIAASGTTLTAADKAKITQGLYTAWSYQQMYRRNDITTGDVVTVYNDIKNAIGSNLGAAGIALSDMQVSRPNDGGTVAP